MESGISGDIAAEKVVVGEGDDDERVAEAALGDHLGDLGGGDEEGGEVFGVVEFGRVEQLAVFDEYGVAGIALDGGVGEDVADGAGIGSGVAGFFAEFPYGGVEGGGVGGVDDTAGDFEFHGFGAVAVLLDEDEFVVGGGSDDIHPIGAIDDVEGVFLSGAWGDGVVFAEGEDAEVTEVAGAGFFPGLDHENPRSLAAQPWLMSLSRWVRVSSSVC
jgi:hypothetical protein